MKLFTQKGTQQLACIQCGCSTCPLKQSHKCARAYFGSQAITLFRRAIKASQKCLTKFIKIQLSLFESLVLSAEHRPHYREGCAATFRLQKKVFFF